MRWLMDNLSPQWKFSKHGHDKFLDLIEKRSFVNLKIVKICLIFALLAEFFFRWVDEIHALHRLLFMELFIFDTEILTLKF
jgi:hypothetical protein